MQLNRTYKIERDLRLTDPPTHRLTDSPTHRYVNVRPSFVDVALILTSPRTSHLDIATDVALISPWAAPYLHLHIAADLSSRHRHRRHFRHGQRLIPTSLSSTAEYRP